MNPDTFESDDVAKSRPVSHRTINQYGGTTCKFGATIARSTAHALKTFYCRGTLGTRVNPDTIGCVWTGEFDLNTLRVDGKIFESGKKKLRIQKYPDTCGLNDVLINNSNAIQISQSVVLGVSSLTNRT